MSVTKSPSISLDRIRSASSRTRAFPQRGRTVIAFVFIGLGLSAVAFVTGKRLAAARAVANGRTIVAGVKIADVPVGGLTETEAAEKARLWARQALTKPVTLIAPISKRTWNLTLGECGGRFNIANAAQEALTVGKNETLWRQVIQSIEPRDVVITPAFALDEKRLQKRLKEIGRQVRVRPRNARVQVSGGAIRVVAPEQKGVRLDIAATEAALLKGDPENLRNGGSAMLAVIEEKPRIATGDAQRIDTLLASYRTDYSSSIPSRKHNVEMAVERLNGALLAPGETFSYNDRIGERTESEGWRNAKMYQDGAVVDGTGAGICQVSSTLYNVVLRADLAIVERAPHSLPVHYVPPGQDATVVYGATDFRFRNTTDGPLYISARTDNGDVVVGVWGAKPANPKRVRLITASLIRLPDGGFRSRTYKEVTDSAGHTAREYLSTDTYHAPKKPDRSQRR